MGLLLWWTVFAGRLWGFYFNANAAQAISSWNFAISFAVSIRIGITALRFSKQTSSCYIECEMVRDRFRFSTLRSWALDVVKRCQMRENQVKCILKKRNGSLASLSLYFILLVYLWLTNISHMYKVQQKHIKTTDKKRETFKFLTTQKAKCRVDRKFQSLFLLKLNKKYLTQFLLSLSLGHLNKFKAHFSGWINDFFNHFFLIKLWVLLLFWLFDRFKHFISLFVR